MRQKFPFLVPAAEDAEAAAVEKSTAPDRQRSTYLIEDPDGNYACGIRISSIHMPSKAASLSMQRLLELQSSRRSQNLHTQSELAGAAAPGR